MDIIVRALSSFISMGAMALTATLSDLTPSTSLPNVQHLMTPVEKTVFLDTFNLTKLPELYQLRNQFEVEVLNYIKETRVSSPDSAQYMFCGLDDRNFLYTFFFHHIDTYDPYDIAYRAIKNAQEAYCPKAGKIELKESELHLKTTLSPDAVEFTREAFESGRVNLINLAKGG